MNCAQRTRQATEPDPSKPPGGLRTPMPQWGHQSPRTADPVINKGTRTNVDVHNSEAGEVRVRAVRLQVTADRPRLGSSTSLLPYPVVKRLTLELLLLPAHVQGLLVRGFPRS